MTHALSSLDLFASNILAQLDAQSLRRSVTETEPIDAIRVRRNGRELVSFSSNDYLGLSQDIRLKNASIDAIKTYGAGAGASRLVVGNHPLFKELERRLAKLKGTEAAIVLGSGYLANSGIIPTLTGPKDVIFIDELAHACIHAGAQLARSKVARFRHNDTGDLRALLKINRKQHRHALIITDGVFSMDGDVAPIAALQALAKDYDAWLMTDDAHGVGVLGAGAGSSHTRNILTPLDLQMGTLSKALGGYGGYLCASQPVIDLILTRCRPFIYSTGLPPAVVGSAIEALRIITEDVELCARPIKNARLFTSLLNLPDAESPIVPVIIGAAEETLAAAKHLEASGFLVVPIRPPTVPVGTARLRATFSAHHTEQQISTLAALIKPYTRQGT